MVAERRWSANGHQPPSLLERRYRRLLAVLPAEYLRVREQELVDTFLQSRLDADPEMADVTAAYGHPDLAERLSIVRLACRLRWGGPSDPPRCRVRGEATRLFAVLGLLVLAGTAMLQLVALLVTWLTVPPELAAAVWPASDATLRGAWTVLTSLCWLAWIPAFLLTVCGAPRGGLLAGLCAFLPSAVSVVVAVLAGTGTIPSVWGLLAVQLLVLVCLTAFHSDAPRPHRAGWLVAFGAAVVASQSIWLLVGVIARIGLDTAMLWVAATVAATVLAAVGAPRRTAEQRVARWSSVAGLAFVAVVLRAITTVEYLRWMPPSPLHTTMLVSGVVQGAVLMAMLATAVSMAIGGFRRLPPVRYGTGRPPTAFDSA